MKHKFIEEIYQGNSYKTCKKCEITFANIKKFYSTGYYVSLNKGISWIKTSKFFGFYNKMTCDEVIIKNIIE